MTARRLIPFALTLALCAGAAHAQDTIERIPDMRQRSAPPPRQAGAPTPPPPPREQLFISPSGEPFRAPPGAAYPVVAWFEAADADHDGSLTQAEFIADALRFFDKLDENHDGVIDGFEAQDYETKVAPEILNAALNGADIGPRGGGQQAGPPPGGRGGRGRGGGGGGLFGGGNRGVARGSGPDEGAARYSLLNEAEPVLGQDSVLDGKISKAEATTAARRRFALLDKMHTGVLKLADLPKTPVQKQAEAPPVKGKKPPR